MAIEIKIGTPFLKEQPDFWAYGVVTGISNSQRKGTTYIIKFVEGHKKTNGNPQNLETVPLKPTQHTIGQGQNGITFLPHPDTMYDGLIT